VYEFIDADEDVGPGSITGDFRDLEVGREYHVVLSHIGGLYRYALGDVIRVLGRVAGVPRVEYAGRSTLSDDAGERLRESHIVRALQAVVGRTGLEILNATCRCERSPTEADGPRGRYAFALALRFPPTASEKDVLAAIIDDALREISSGYRRARIAGRLGAPVHHLTAPDAFFRQWQARVASGARPAQVKDRVFQQDGGAWEALVAPHRPGCAK
jgi:hypothetical protein